MWSSVPTGVTSFLCFCSRSLYPWQTAWIHSSCLQMMPLWLPGITRACQMIGCPLRMLPSWPPVSVGHSSLTHSSRESSGSETGLVQSWGWCSWDKEGQWFCQLLITVFCFNMSVVIIPKNVHVKKTFLCLSFVIHLSFFQQVSRCDWASSCLWWNRSDRKSARKDWPSPGTCTGQKHNKKRKVSTANKEK